MSIDVANLIRELNEVDEHERIEAKTGTEAGKAVMKTVVAFSNEPRLDGGYILFGVEKAKPESPERYNIVGVADPDKLSADFSTQCADMLNRRIRPRMTTKQIDGKSVVAAYVPEAQPAQKPVYIKKQGIDHGVYRRISSTDQRCGDEDLEEIYQERSGNTYDASIVSYADLEDIDRDAVDDYRKTRERVNSEAQELNWDDEDLLRALRCAVKKDGRLTPTVAGILLFGSKMALRRLFPAMRIDYTRVPGRRWMEDPDRRYTNSIEIRAPLIQAIRRAQSAIVDDLPKGFSLPEGSLQRTDEPLIPLQVLREAVVNAVMHRTYRRHGAIHIVRYSNRIEIQNPGHSLVDPNELDQPRSLTRNPVIASVLHDTRFAETKGTGIEVMRAKLKKAGLAPPKFDSDRQSNQFTTTLYLHHFLDTEDLNWLTRFKHLELSQAEVRGLVHAREAGRIDNKTYRELNGLETLKASQDLRRLREAGLLVQQDKGRATYYEPTEQLLVSPEAPSQGELTFQDQPSGEEKRRGEETAKLKDKRSKLDPQTAKLEEETTKPDQEAAKLESPDAAVAIPEHLEARILSVHGSRTSTQELRALIERLCAIQPFASSEIAKMLGKDASYISHMLSAMIADGRLERTRPDTPRSPNQKYRTVSRN
jgi:ATP-dependent DNA helicase RecG